MFTYRKHLSSVCTKFFIFSTNITKHKVTVGRVDKEIHRGPIADINVYDRLQKDHGRDCSHIAAFLAVMIATAAAQDHRYHP